MFGLVEFFENATFSKFGFGVFWVEILFYTEKDKKGVLKWRNPTALSRVGFRFIFCDYRLITF
jgi:hypothetical protein